MTISLYKKGQKVRCLVNFKVDDGLTDPTTVTFKSKKPSGTVTTLVYGTDAAVVKDATGQYHADVVTDEKGEWNFRFEGTGICTAVEESAFNVTSVFS
jgi:uncharacterized protein YfaS (alpha-2-macroglobulin family)